ncbi:MAG: BrnA antitoxin family protein [Bdellovibrionales bacterium]|nr:BrnA antitoxin family protein [Bdellovibrionales bacterium]
MTDDADFRRATRRLLFPEPEPVQSIPGAGTSAAAESDKHARVKVTINLDGDIVAHFKEQAKCEGIPYQSLINRTLREFMLGAKPERMAKEVGGVLLDDHEFLEQLSLIVHQKMAAQQNK